VLSDIVVVSTASRTYVITKDLVKRVMKRRRGRTLFIVDISVPRNVDPAAHEDVDNCFVYNVDDLEQTVAEGLRARKSEAAAAEAIVASELEDWKTWVRGLDVQPTIVGLRAKTRAVLHGELERSLAGKLRHLGQDDQKALAQMMDAALNKLLHGPTTRLKGDGGGDLVRAARALFDLPGPAENEGDEPRPEGGEPRVEH
ncbi:MAG: glutamyl-tRNA reductase, partial [Myxococcales bacterium]|nr:glutamyl-tRNA reductase [Myxococcales bacterium]